MKQNPSHSPSLPVPPPICRPVTSSPRHFVPPSLLFFSFLFLLSPPSFLYAQTLTGTVIDSATGNPIKNATVALKAAGKAVMTDEQGKFSFNVGTKRSMIRYNPVEKLVKVEKNEIVFSIEGNTAEVVIGLYSLSGKFLKRIVCGTYDKGIHTVKIIEDKAMATGIYVLQSRIGQSERSVILPFTAELGFSTFYSENKSYAGRSYASIGTSDTLITDRYGYYSDIKKGTILTSNLAIKLKRMPDNAIVPPGMKLIDSNTFIMGSQNYDANETPEHDVTLSSYFVDSTEVTQLDFETVMKAKPWENSTVEYPGGKGPYQPVWGVNWYDAVYYCNKRSKRDGLDTVYRYLAITGTPGDGCNLDSVFIDYSKKGYRLLTEAEWEYAYGAGRRDKFPWGNTGDSESYYTWYELNSGKTSHPVATKLPNVFGLYDMSGNVREWVNDWEGDYPQLPQINPTGSAYPDVLRMMRGGHWLTGGLYLRTTKRGFCQEFKRQGVNGLRVALSKR